MYKHLVLLVALSFFGSSLAYAGFDEGKAACQTGDYAAAYKEFKAAADQGNADAQFLLGRMYDEGEGVPKDFAEAVKWFRKAADGGNADAQVRLGTMYHFGLRDTRLGVPQDDGEAVKWFRKAAHQGNAHGQTHLGRMYDKGEGVPQDYVKAHMWFNLAAAQGDDIARWNRDKVAKKMTPAQIAEAQRLAREWNPNVKD